MCSCCKRCRAGGRDQLLERLGRCARGGSGNACRNLHRMLVDEKLSLPVSVSIIDIRIKGLRNKQERIVGWPVLRMSDWARCALGRGGQMLLAGHCLEDEPAWRAQLQDFWSHYSKIDGGHPVFSSGIDTSATVPFMVHGDEGRGRGKQPLLTISFQGILSHYGGHRTNMSGFRTYIGNIFFSTLSHKLGDDYDTGFLRSYLRHSFCSRLLYACFPSQCYADDDASIYALLDDLSMDCLSLFKSGLEEPGLYNRSENPRPYLTCSINPRLAKPP